MPHKLFIDDNCANGEKHYIVVMLLICVDNIEEFTQGQRHGTN